MRKLILKISVSADGFVCGQNDEMDWMFASLDTGASAWIADTLWQAGVHIMGSRTFYDMKAYWPYSDELFAAPMNEISKIVFSKSGIKNNTGGLTTQALTDTNALRTAKGFKINPVKPKNMETWDNAVWASGNLADEIATLKQQPGKYILAHGGASFVQSLTALGLIDEYRLLVHPVALGSGKALFAAMPKPLNLKLIDIIMFKAGAAAHIYQPA